MADRLADIVKKESLRGEVGSYQTLAAVELFYNYLVDENQFLSNHFLEITEAGRAYVLSQIRGAIDHFRNVNAQTSSTPDILDA